MYISENVIYVGTDDTSIDLFESQYPVPNGISYNSYLILDKKIAVADTVDARCTEEWMQNLAKALNGRKPDYLILHHLEPDHSGSIRRFLEQYPDVTLVGNKKTFPMLQQFYDIPLDEKQLITVGEGEELSLGTHRLQFFMAPLVHWPEVMVSWESSEGLLFSADAFGTFGALSSDVDWNDDAGHYYFNIVGKYGAQVQALLKKTEGLDIKAICPLHGPVLRENLWECIRHYQCWSSYEAEEKAVVIAYASFHGNTAGAAKLLAGMLREKGEKDVRLYDLNREDISEVVENAFRCDRLVLASVTYDGSLAPAMEDFLYHLKIKNFQKRTIGYIQNGSWGPVSLKFMKAYIAEMKDMTEVEPAVTIKSAVSKANESELEALADALIV